MTRTLFIGLDGATFTVLNELTRELPGVGVTMPFLRQFLQTGTQAKLRSTPNPLTPPAWVSIMTGRTPGQHGVFDFVRFEDKGEDVYFTLYDARDIRTETLWSMASRQARTVVALNFPFTAPPRPVAGSLVPGFVPWRHLRRNTSPPDLYERLKEIPGFDPKELAWDFERENQTLTYMAQADLENWVQYHIVREEQWFRVAEKLLQEDQPDLMAVLFDGTDKLQHQVWAFLDPALFPSQPAPWQQSLRNSCLDYFRKLDGYLAQLVDLAGPEAQVFMASDHGFTATTEVVRINAFLHEKGYLAWRQTEDESADVVQRREASNFAYLDWQNTLAYCPTPSSNGIVIRVAHQPGEPGIAPEAYESFRAKLIRDLESLTDERSGERIIQAILKREEVYAGPATPEAPDLTLVLRDYGFVSIRNLLPVVEPRQEPQGTHHPDGIFLARGPGIAAGVDGERQEVADVPATLLYSLGLPIPDDLDGRLAQGFFTPDYLRSRPPVVGEATAAQSLQAKDEADSISDADQAKILAQLQMLGYLE